jgi:hypothetical protein
MCHSVTFTQACAHAAELIDAVVGVDTHRDTHEVEIALPTGIVIGTRRISNDNSGFAELLAWSSSMRRDRGWSCRSRAPAASVSGWPALSPPPA